MNKNDTLITSIIDISKCILDETFKHWYEAETDDIELEIKRVIQGTQNYYQKHNDNKKEIELISNVLRQYAENKYMETWEKNWENEINDDNYEEIMEKGKQTFNYVFKNEEHPPSSTLQIN